MTSSSSHIAEGNELRVALGGSLFTYRRNPGCQQLFDQTFPVLASMKQKFPSTHYFGLNPPLAPLPSTFFKRKIPSSGPK